jgi:hypothetical protein
MSYTKWSLDLCPVFIRWDDRLLQTQVKGLAIASLVLSSRE